MKPLLAVAADTNNIVLPVLFSPKLDGIRALIIDGQVLSRKLKPIPNDYVQFLFGKREYEGFDGELIVGAPNAPDVYRQTNSGVMSKDGEPDVRFHIFDRFDRPGMEFTHRYATLPHTSTVKRVSLVPHHYVSDLAALLSLETRYLQEGYEGGMLRKPDGPYKFGRSTLKEGILLKLKRMESDEAEILEVIELQRNMNEAITNALGHTERSSHKENQVAGGTMGAITVKSLSDGSVFQIGTGFTAEDRTAFWDDRENVIGKIICYKHFPIGRKTLPRHPSFKGFRSQDDM